jgi:hypothetical protein
MDQIRIYPKKVFCVIASFAMNSEDVYIADGSYCDTGSYYYYVEIKPFHSNQSSFYSTLKCVNKLWP